MFMLPKGDTYKFTIYVTEDDYNYYDIKVSGAIKQGIFTGQLFAPNADSSLLQRCNADLATGISVTPGIPPIIDTKSDKRLMGKVTPVKAPVRLTANNVAAPKVIESRERLNGCLFLPRKCKIAKVINVTKIIRHIPHQGIFNNSI